MATASLLDKAKKAINTVGQALTSTFAPSAEVSAARRLSTFGTESKTVAGVSIVAASAALIAAPYAAGYLATAGGGTTAAAATTAAAGTATGVGVKGLLIAGGAGVATGLLLSSGSKQTGAPQSSNQGASTGGDVTGAKPQLFGPDTTQGGSTGGNTGGPSTAGISNTGAASVNVIDQSRKSNLFSTNYNYLTNYQDQITTNPQSVPSTTSQTSGLSQEQTATSSSLPWLIAAAAAVFLLTNKHG